MARPSKQGLDWFPQTVDLYERPVMQILQSLHGDLADIAIPRLECRLHKVNGYYLEFAESDCLRFAAQIKKPHEQVRALVEDAIKWGLWDRELFERHQILTSVDAQKVFLNAARKRTGLKILPEHWLLEGKPKRVSAPKTRVSAPETPVSAEVIPQSIADKSRADQIVIDKAAAAANRDPLLPPLPELFDLESAFGIPAVEHYRREIESRGDKPKKLGRYLARILEDDSQGSKGFWKRKPIAHSSNGNGAHAPAHPPKPTPDQKRAWEQIRYVEELHGHDSRAALAALREMAPDVWAVAREMTWQAIHRGIKSSSLKNQFFAQYPAPGNGASTNATKEAP